MKSALKTTFVGYILLVLTAINTSAQEYYYSSCDSFLIGDKFKIVENDQSEIKHSFSERTYVYCSPDSTRQPLGFVNFNTQLSTIETVSHIRRDSFVMYSNRPTEYTYTYHFSNWKKINFRKGFGYVKATDLADEYHEEGQFLIQSYRSGNILKAISSDRKNKGSLSRIELPSFHGYRIRICHQNGLANSGLLIAYETFRQSCPGASNITLIILNENGFSELVSSFSTGEAGMFEQESIYYPLIMADSSVKLIAANHIIYNGVDFESVDYNEVPGYMYPENIGIPIERLVVKTKSYTENILDKYGAELIDKNGVYKVNEIHEAPVFYEWNGDALIELKSDYYLSRLDSILKSPIDTTVTKDSSLQNELPIKKNSGKINEKPPFSPFLSGIVGFIIALVLFWIILMIRKRMKQSH